MKSLRPVKLEMDLCDRLNGWLRLASWRKLPCTLQECDTVVWHALCGQLYSPAAHEMYVAYRQNVKVLRL
jgi:hypothetical protein